MSRHRRVAPLLLATLSMGLLALDPGAQPSLTVLPIGNLAGPRGQEVSKAALEPLVSALRKGGLWLSIRETTHLDQIADLWAEIDGGPGTLSDATVRRVQKLLDVDFAVVGTISVLRDRFHLVTRVVSLDDGSIEASEEVDFEEGGLSQAVQELGVKLCASLGRDSRFLPEITSSSFDFHLIEERVDSVSQKTSFPVEINPVKVKEFSLEMDYSTGFWSHTIRIEVNGRRILEKKYEGTHVPVSENRGHESVPLKTVLQNESPGSEWTIRIQTIGGKPLSDMSFKNVHLRVVR